MAHPQRHVCGEVSMLWLQAGENIKKMEEEVNGNDSTNTKRKKKEKK